MSLGTVRAALVIVLVVALFGPAPSAVPDALGQQPSPLPSPEPTPGAPLDPPSPPPGPTPPGAAPTPAPTLAQTPAPATPAPTAQPRAAARIAPGIDTLLEQPDVVKGKRVGLVTHLAGFTASGELTAKAIMRVDGLRLTALFAPEHGLDGTYDAGERVPSRQGRTPVYSLYGATYEPTREMLSRVDALVVDMQDVGVRAFTYTSTMSLVMRAARRANKEVIVLDRPNPMGGTVIDGPVLEPQFRSFIGMHQIPYVFGLTMGELARLYNDAFGIGARLTVVPMRGWSRTMTWTDTGLPWQNPSPGITGPGLVFTYAATGPLDGTNLWNGVATDARFQVVLAPWLDGARLAERLNRKRLPGVSFAPAAVPLPSTGKPWHGVRLLVTDPLAFRPNATIVHVLVEIRRQHPDKFRFREYRRGPHLFDLVWGTKAVRLGIARGDSAERIIAAWQPGLAQFQRLRARYYLYR